MRVFVDESGDSGIKQGASEYFVVTLVLIEEGDVPALEACIRQTREALGRTERFEFHFKDNSDNIRTIFFQAIIGHQFQYFACVVNKTDYYAAGQSSGQEFYRWVCEKVFEQAKPFLLEARVVLDKRSEREFCRTMEARLKQALNSKDSEVKAIRSVTTADSHRTDLLQLADMICGAVARSYRADRSEPAKYRKMIKHREYSVQMLP